MLPEEDKTVLCIEWVDWPGIYAEGVYMHPYKITGAIMVSPVDGEPDLYRRIGWLEAGYADFFGKEPRDILLV